MNSIYLPNDSYSLKPGRTVFFVFVFKYLASASVVFLIFLPKIFTTNKITFWLSNSLNLKKSFKRFQKLTNKKTRKLYKNPHRNSLSLIMNYQLSSIGGEGS